MTSKIFKIVSVVLAITIMIGCGKKETIPNAASINVNNLKSIDMSGQKVYLKYQFKKDQKLRYKLTTISNSVQTIKVDSLMKSNSDQSLTYIFDLEVVDVDKDNIAELVINISSINFNGISNGQKLNYDSKAKLSKEDKDKFAEFETVVNSPYRVRVNQKGEILEVTRIDKMADKMISLRPDMQKITAEQKVTLIKNISEGEIRPRTQLLFRELPSKEVARDSSWQLTSPATLAVFRVESISKFKVDDFVKAGDDKMAKLSATLTSKWTGNKKGTQEGMNYLFDDPKINGDGSILFNIDKGLVIKSETTTNVEMGVTIDGKDATQKMRHSVRKDLSMNKNTVELL
ncbi:MAG: DUF6263 family protein [Ignavibacteriales bacterium]|nr:DUF6263 family protein [Ignavibacteriales bacterium]